MNPNTSTQYNWAQRHPCPKDTPKGNYRYFKPISNDINCLYVTTQDMNFGCWLWDMDNMYTLDDGDRGRLTCTELYIELTTTADVMLELL